MRKILLTLAGSAALLSASAASAAVTIGTASSTCTPNPGCLATATATDVVGEPNKAEFDTTNANAGTFTSLFNFVVTDPRTAVFSVTTATNPSSQVTLLELLMNGTSIYSSGGTGTSLNLLTGLLTPGNNYQFRYTVTLATAGDVSGTGSFYAASTPSVPEPASWALMLLGFGGMGMVMRRRRRPVLAQIA